MNVEAIYYSTSDDVTEYKPARVTGVQPRDVDTLRQIAAKSSGKELTAAGINEIHAILLTGERGAILPLRYWFETVEKGTPTEHVVEYFGKPGEKRVSLAPNPGESNTFILTQLSPI